MPIDTFEELDAIATAEGRPTVEIIRRFINLGLHVKEAQERGAEVLVREEGKEDKLVVFI